MSTERLNDAISLARTLRHLISGLQRQWHDCMTANKLVDVCSQFVSGKCFLEGLKIMIK